MQNDIVKQPKQVEQDGNLSPTQPQSEAGSVVAVPAGTPQPQTQPVVADPDIKPRKKDKKKKKKPDEPLEPVNPAAQPLPKSKNGVGAVVSVAVIICVVLIGIAVYAQM